MSWVRVERLLAIWCRAEPSLIQEGFRSFRQLQPDAFTTGKQGMRSMADALRDPASGVQWWWAPKVVDAAGCIELERLQWRPLSLDATQQQQQQQQGQGQGQARELGAYQQETAGRGGSQGAGQGGSQLASAHPPAPAADTCADAGPHTFEQDGGEQVSGARGWPGAAKPCCGAARIHRTVRRPPRRQHLDAASIISLSALSALRALRCAAE